MQTVTTTKGHDIKIAGPSDLTVFQAAAPVQVAAVPAQLPSVKPKLQVAVGDRVRIGSLLYTDTSRPLLRFVSPGAGHVAAIHRGPRRAVTQIVIALDAREAEERFAPTDAKGLAAMARQEVVNRLAAGGLWPLLKCLPFRTIAPLDAVPPAIVVSMDNREPFHPDPAVYLAGSTAGFAFGLEILKKLCPRVIVAGRRDDPAPGVILDGVASCRVRGPYPADDPGVICYRIKRHPSENTSWFIQGQDVILLGRLLAEGRYPVERIVAVGGSAAARTGHCRTRLGAPLAVLSPPLADGRTVRRIAGGIFSGRDAGPDGHLGLGETGIALIPEGDQREFLALFSPGWRKPTASRSFLSRLNPRPLAVDCRRHGGERACIGCMACERVCPVDLLPQFIYKAILAEEVETHLAHGLLDCVECGLCSYVCPAKIELTASMKAARTACYRDRA